MSHSTSDSSSRCICRVGYHCCCSRPEVATRPYVYSRPKKIHVASDLMIARTDQTRVANAVVQISFDDKKKCCGDQCVGSLVLKYELDNVVDAILAARRGILCGDQVQKIERLRMLLNRSYDEETRHQHFYFYNPQTLPENAPDRFKVRYHGSASSHQTIISPLLSHGLIHVPAVPTVPAVELLYRIPSGNRRGRRGLFHITWWDQYVGESLLTFK
jgi:hypothetical protein